MAGNPNTPFAVLPQYQGNLYDLQTKQALAQALMQKGLNGDLENYRPAGGGFQYVPQYGAGSVVAQIGNALLGGELQHQASEGMSQLGAQQMAFLMGSPQDQQGVSAAGAQSTPGSSGAGANPQAQAPAQGGGGLLSPGSALNPSGMDPGRAAYLYQTLGPVEYAKNFVAPYVKPTDATLMARAGGVDARQANRDALFHANYVAPNQGTPGTVARDPRTNKPIYYSPEVPKGGEPVFDAGGNVVGVKEVNGALKLIGQTRAVETAGEGSQLPYSGVDESGNPLPITNRTAAATQAAGATTPGQAAIVQAESNGNPAAVSPKGARGAWQVMPNTNANPGFGVTPARDNSPAEMNRVGKDYYEAMSQRYGSPTLGAVAYNMGPGATDAWLKGGAQWEKLPPETREYVGKVSTLTALNSGAGAPQRQQIYAAPPMGAQANAQAAATNQQGELSKKWESLNGQNQQAQSVISNLQNIRSLASQAATGQQVDRLNYINGLLSLAGSEKATDMVTANNLLDKYSNQIVARLGQGDGKGGGMGSDAARAILQSAYPNSHMTPQAIHEAVDNIVGATQMVQAKARLLAPLANKRDAAGYNDTEVKFDQNADPRIWQLQGMNSQQQAAYVNSLPPNVAQQLLKQRRELMSMGALQ